MTTPPVYRLLVPSWASAPRRTRVSASMRRAVRRRGSRKPARTDGRRSSDSWRFEIAEREDREGARHLSLTGELDVAAAPILDRRLRDLSDRHTAVRLDLSKLQFMDSAGLHLLLHAMSDAQSDGWNLEIAPEIPRQIARLVDLTATRATLWPGSTRD